MTPDKTTDQPEGTDMTRIGPAALDPDDATLRRLIRDAYTHPALDGDPAPHRLDVTISPHLEAPELRVTCTAPPGAACRLTCTGAVAGRCDERCADDCDGTLVDGGVCLAVSWLDGDPDYIYAAYDGPARPFTSGPVDCRWDPTEAAWSWRYAADRPTVAAVRESARVAP